MIRKAMVLAAAVSMLAGPSLAAGLDTPVEPGERRSGAAAGLYFSIPFGGPRGGIPQAGLRLQMSHDYRNAQAQTAPVVQANLFDLRLVGDRQTTFYVAGMPLNGEEARRHNLAGAGTVVTIAVIAAAIVGAVVIAKALDDDDDEQCLLPEGCP